MSQMGATDPQPFDGTVVSSLASLLQPMTVESFGETHWGREPLHISRGVSTFYDGLVSLVDLERYFSLGEVFRRHTVQTVSRRWAAGGPPQNLGDINDRLLHGDSLRLRRMECFLDPSTSIVALAREMEATLQHPLGSLSCYVTPADAVGLGPHHDETEIFTLQIEGTKRWQVFHRVESTEPAMYERSALGEPSLEVTLAPGDLLYMPHGWVHDVASNEASFSITIVFNPFRWAAVFEAIGERLRDLVPLTETMPMGIALGGGRQEVLRNQLEACLKVIRNELDAFDGSSLVDTLAATLLGRMSIPPGPVISNMLRLDQMTLFTLVQRRRNVACHVARHADSIAVMVPGGQVIHVSDRVEAAVRTIMVSEAPFRVADVHPTLDDPSKMSLVRSLIGAGLLEFASGNGG